MWCYIKRANRKGKLTIISVKESCRHSHKLLRLLSNFLSSYLTLLKMDDFELAQHEHLSADFSLSLKNVFLVGFERYPLFMSFPLKSYDAYWFFDMYRISSRQKSTMTKIIGRMELISVFWCCWYLIFC